MAGKRPQSWDLQLPASTFSYAVYDLHGLGLTEPHWVLEDRTSYAVLTKGARRLLRQASVRVQGDGSGKQVRYVKALERSPR